MNFPKWLRGKYNHCCATPPPFPSHERANARTSADRSALVFLRILVILFLAYSSDKTQFLRFLVHSSIVITFRVIINIVRK